MSAHGLDPGDPATHGRGSLGELADAGSTRSTRLRDETSCLAGEESMPRYARVPCNHSTWDAWSMLDARSMSCCKDLSLRASRTATTRGSNLLSRPTRGSLPTIPEFETVEVRIGMAAAILAASMRWCECVRMM